MKKTARILSLVFLVLLVVSILVACSGGKDPAVQKKDDPVKTEEPAPVTDPGEKEGENEGETVVYGYNEQNNGVGKDGKTVVRDYSK